MSEIKSMTVSQLIDGVMPCIKAKQYSESYINGFYYVFNRLTSYCEEHCVQYYSTELAQQFLLDCYGVRPGTVERRCSRAHRASNVVMISSLLIVKCTKRSTSLVNASTTDLFCTSTVSGSAETTTSPTFRKECAYKCDLHFLLSDLSIFLLTYNMIKFKCLRRKF